MSVPRWRNPWTVLLAAAAVGACAVLVAVYAVGDDPSDQRPAPLPGAASLADDFNGAAVGAGPPGWSTAGGGTVTVAAVPDQVERSLQLSRPAGAGAVSASRAFAPVTGTVEVHARVRVESAAAGYDVLRIADGSADDDGTALVAVGAEAGWFIDPVTGRQLATAVPGRWYALQAVLRTEERRYDLSVDGRQVTADAALSTDADRTGEVTVGRVRMGVHDGPAGTLRVDTVSVQRIPDPSVEYVVFDRFNDPALLSTVGQELTISPENVTVSAVPSDENRSLLLAKAAGGSEAVATRRFQPQAGTVIVQANIRTDEVIGTKLALGVSTSAAVMFDGEWLTYDDGDAAHRLVEITAGEWYTVKLVLDTAAPGVEIYIDGRRYAPSSDGPLQRRWPFRQPAPNGIGRLSFGVAADQFGTVRVDDVMVFRSPVTEPPGPVLDVRRAPYGAVGDGVQDDTDAIQRAIDDASPGGSVLLAAGVFRAGTIRLRSDLTLWINPDAVLLGSTDDAAYEPLRKDEANSPFAGGLLTRGFVTAAGADRVRIDGGGTLDGNGHNPAWGIEGGTHRPALIALTRGHDVSIRNIHVRDAATWAIVTDEIDGLLIADVTVDSDIYANRDGIDVVDSHSVLIERVALSTDDDALCFKSYSTKGVDGAVVRLSTIGQSSRANGVKFGTGSTTAFRNVIVEDLLIKHVDKAAITVAAVDGTIVSNVAFRRITVVDALRAIFVLLGRRDGPASQSGDATPSAAGGLAAPIWVSGMAFEDVVGERLAEPSALSGQQVDGTVHRLYGLLLSGLRLTVTGGVERSVGKPTEYTGNYPESNHWTGENPLPAYGFYVRHVTGLTVHDTTVRTTRPDTRPPLVFDDAQSLATD